nr:hypothetical protein [Tanacetum cinerariifolium]
MYWPIKMVAARSTMRDRLSRDGDVSGVSLTVVSSSDDKNGEVAGSGGIWPDVGSSDGSDSASDAGESFGDAGVWSGDG